jgi:protein dithiol oxidoreductase (disulfide-forming)
MRAPRSVLLLCLTLALAACGKHQTANERAPAGAPPASALSQPPAHTAPAAPPGAGAGLAGAPSKPVKVNQDGSETVEDGSGDSGAHNPLLAAVASTVAMATSPATADVLATPTPWQEGVNYTRIVPAQPTSVAAGQVEVLEFFWYACPHCYSLDPQVDAWKKTKPAYISFSRVPVTWTEGHRSLARLFYTLQELGKLDQLHDEVFKEIHVNGDPLVARNPDDAAETERLQAAFAKKEGISEDVFQKAYHSFAVDNDVARADELAQRYRIDGVPTFVVNGKFIADVRTAAVGGSADQGPTRLMALVSDLAALEHKH